MGNEVFIESLLRGQVRTFPALEPCATRRLLGHLQGVVEYHFEQDEHGRFTEVIFPLGADSWYLAAGFVGKTFAEIDPDAARNSHCWQRYQDGWGLRQSLQGLGFCWHAPGGSPRHYLINAAPAYGVDGLFKGYSGVVIDVSEDRRKDSYVETVEHAAVGIAHIDQQGIFIFVNRKLCEILGYEREELLGQLADNLSHPDDRGKVMRQCRDGLDFDGKTAIRVEKRYRRKNGDYIWVRLNITQVADERAGHHISVLEDITERVRTEENFKYLATHDELTALPNRMLFSHLLRHSVEEARKNSAQIAVLMIDLDRFKNIVDSLGHAAGDYVLQEMGQRILALVGSSNVVARFSGDEFIVMLKGIDHREQAAAVAAALLERIAAPVRLIHHECRLTASIGITLYPHDGDDEMSLLRRADQAMYLAKAEGKNNFQFCPLEEEGGSLSKIRMEALLHTALTNEELTLHYQAKVDVRSGQVIGAEALLRWHNPELGQVSPATFVPVVEELELIFPIGRWVIETACAQISAWRKAGFAIKSLAVNLSPRQFADPALTEFIAQTLARFALPGDALELEITEGVVMQRPERALQILRSIKALGVHIAIDDFGTGYSSLGQLKRLPVDTLKVDRAFIQELEQDEGDQACTRAIITMAKALGLSVVAEGVETAGQASFLREQGCDLIQGYFYSRPCAAAEFETLLAA